MPGASTNPSKMFTSSSAVHEVMMMMMRMMMTMIMMMAMTIVMIEQTMHQTMLIAHHYLSKLIKLFLRADEAERVLEVHLEQVKVFADSRDALKT